MSLSPNRVPTIYDLTVDLADGETPESVALGSRSDAVRRDIILGGEGNDVLQGGAGEDWIFGGSGNDVLSGGLDRQAEDLLFGNEGDDTFQIIPDRLPQLSEGSDETFLPTLSDRLDGGVGDDRVLFLGGDTDDVGRPVPDDVAIDWNRFLHRYAFTALSWDTANQEFAVEREVLNATRPAPENGQLSSDATFRLRVAGGPFPGGDGGGRRDPFIDHRSGPRPSVGDRRGVWCGCGPRGVPRRCNAIGGQGQGPGITH